MKNNRNDRSLVIWLPNPNLCLLIWTFMLVQIGQELFRRKRKNAWFILPTIPLTVMLRAQSLLSLRFITTIILTSLKLKILCYGLEQKFNHWTWNTFTWEMFQWCCIACLVMTEVRVLNVQQAFCNAHTNIQFCS